ncbi:MAG: hypothetical protein COB36_09930 [Alphaproteobacteria bacterium]|nr:MAG: hypothetical protein COB36_09930 [Alphaproteobacteria bacterium]
MIDIIHPEQRILYMKVGVHAREPLDKIFERKNREIEQAGYTFWGYGGNTCHPTTKVQPFARDAEKADSKIFLCMEEIESKHYAEPVRANQFSIDGLVWNDIHEAIDVVGSRFALAIKDLHYEEMDLPMEKVEVAIGECEGRTGANYIKGRVDKACLRLRHDIGAPIAEGERVVKINLLAEMCAPYAVFLKN